MKPEEQNDLHAQDAPNAQAGGEAADKARREQLFTRRGLLQWTVPAVVAVTLPMTAYAGSGGHSDFNDGGAHTDHTDTFTDIHNDHTDFNDMGQHGDSSGPTSKGGKNSFSTTPAPQTVAPAPGVKPASPSGVVPNLPGTKAPSTGSGVVPSLPGTSAPRSGGKLTPPGLGS